MSLVLRALGLAAALALCAAAHAQDGARGVLTQQALDELARCIAAGTPVRPCLSDALANPADAPRSCKLPACEVAAQPGELGAEQARELLREIALAFKALADASTAFQPAARQLQSDAENDVAELRAGAKLQANDWDVDRFNHPAGDTAARRLQSECAPAAVNCVEEAQNLLALRVSSFAFRSLVQKVNWPDVEKSAACSTLLRQRYEAYFDESRFQWPWELYLNGLPRFKGKTPLLCEGFEDVPAHQWIVMHPSLAIRHSGNAEQKTDAAVIIELIGMRRWRWDGAEAVDARGASLILSYSEQRDAKDLGWGVLVHLNEDVSVGLVRHKSDRDNKVSLMLGYEFGKLVGQDRRAACDKVFGAGFCSRVGR